MNKLLVTTAIAATFCILLRSGPAMAQLLPPAPKAAHVTIIKGPALEIARDDMAILRWTSTNPGGDDEHLAIAHYGTDPHNLSQTAQSHIRLNRTHPDTIFRVRLLGLKPHTTYYYWVTSAGANGNGDGVKSAINRFTTPAPGVFLRPSGQ